MRSTCRWRSNASSKACPPHGVRMRVLDPHGSVPVERHVGREVLASDSTETKAHFSRRSPGDRRGQFVQGGGLAQGRSVPRRPDGVGRRASQSVGAFPRLKTSRRSNPGQGSGPASTGRGDLTRGALAHFFSRFRAVPIHRWGWGLRAAPCSPPQGAAHFLTLDEAIDAVPSAISRPFGQRHS